MHEVVLYPQSLAQCSADCGCSVNTCWVIYHHPESLEKPHNAARWESRLSCQSGWFTLPLSSSLKFDRLSFSLPFLVSINAVQMSQSGVTGIALFPSHIHGSGAFLRKDQTTSFPVRLAACPHLLSIVWLPLRQKWFIQPAWSFFLHILDVVQSFVVWEKVSSWNRLVWACRVQKILVSPLLSPGDPGPLSFQHIEGDWTKWVLRLSCCSLVSSAWWWYPQFYHVCH